MLETLVENRYTITSALLFIIGFVNIILHNNLIMRVVAFNVMDASTFLLLATRGYVSGRTAAILEGGAVDTSLFVNPIPAGLVLTGIVVSVSVSAFSLALIQKIYQRYGSIKLDEILIAAKEGKM